MLFATSHSTAQGTDLRADRRLQLTELLAQERARVEEQEAVAARLRAQVEGGARAAATSDGRVGEVQRRADQLALGSGLVAVRGEGLTVQLDDAVRRPGEPPASDDPDDLVVHQQDLQAVINGLWAGGADALTVMGQRIISISAVRCVGNTVIVNGRVYGPPFVVTALGDPTRMRAALEREPGVRLFRDYVDLYGLGYEVRTESDVTLPAYDGPLDLPAVKAS